MKGKRPDENVPDCYGEHDGSDEEHTQMQVVIIHFLAPSYLTDNHFTGHRIDVKEFVCA